MKDNQKFVYPEEMPHFASYRMSTFEDTDSSSLLKCKE